jgi:hypothetical protein
MLKRIVLLAVMMLAVLLSVNQTSVFSDSPDSSGDVTIEYSSEYRGMFAPLSRLFSWLTSQEVPTDSPSGCIMNVDDPHGSHRQSGYIHGRVRSQCDNRVPVMIHSSTLEKRAWLGWDELLSSTDIFSGINRYSGIAVASYQCEDGAFRARGRGKIIDVDQQIYTARAYGRTENDPCD